MKREEKRNVEIDFLRILTMLLIVIHHILLHGGILKEADHFLPQYKAAWFLDITTLCAVNVYGLISGYVGYKSKHSVSRFLQLYLTVIFYTVVTTLFFSVFRHLKVDLKMALQIIFPFAFEKDVYWYYTAYFCLFFFMPYLDKLIDALNREEAKRMLLTMFIVFSVLQTLFQQQFALTANGYSFLWLSVLYLVGAYIRKYDVGNNEIPWRFLVGYCLSVCFIWIAKMAVEHFRFLITHEFSESLYFTTYTSPFVIICAICLLLAFKKMSFMKVGAKWIAFFAPVTFDIYLLHEEPLIRKEFLIGSFTGFLEFSPVIILLAVIVTAFGIWFIGALIGRLRALIFKGLQVYKLCEWCEKTITIRFQK